MGEQKKAWAEKQKSILFQFAHKIDIATKLCQVLKNILLTLTNNEAVNSKLLHTGKHNNQQNLLSVLGLSQPSRTLD